MDTGEQSSESPRSYLSSLSLVNVIAIRSRNGYPLPSHLSRTVLRWSLADRRVNRRTFAFSNKSTQVYRRYATESAAAIICTRVLTYFNTRLKARRRLRPSDSDIAWTVLFSSYNVVPEMRRLSFFHARSVACVVLDPRSYWKSSTKPTDRSWTDLRSEMSRRACTLTNTRDSAESRRRYATRTDADTPTIHLEHESHKRSSASSHCPERWRRTEVGPRHCGSKTS